MGIILKMLDWLFGQKIKCSRCDYEWFPSQMYNIYNSQYMINHNFPNYINLCIFCHNYLFLGKENREEDDDDKYSILYNRNEEKCRNFDIYFNLLDANTNLYWDECNTIIKEELSDTDNSESNNNQKSLRFKNNSNKIINENLHEKSTTAWYESLKEDAINSYETRFVASMQNFVTRLGLIISEVSNKKFRGNAHYQEILYYICHQIIEDNSIYKKLIKINKPANNSKHSKKNIDININEILTNYNLMIDKLIFVSNCNAFEICHIYNNRKTISEIECSYCGRIKPDKSYRCKVCKKIVCDECFDREKKICCECAKI